MAYAALVSLAQTIDKALHHMSVEQQQQIRTIQECTTQFQKFLEDFPEKARSLEGQIRDAAYEAEDVIEYLEWNRRRFRSGLTTPIFSFEQEIDRIAGEMTGKQQLGDSSATTSSSSKFAPPYDIEGDLKAIKNHMCGESSRLQVIPIFGTEGIGKTTLTSCAYHDPFVIEYFQVRVWVDVSRNYSKKKFLCNLLCVMKEFNRERLFDLAQSSARLEKEVYKILQGRRYLILMDDVWNTEVWYVIRNIFPDDNNGSRIMLTTRLPEVAAYPDIRSTIYEMRLLDEDQSWNLLRYQALAYQDCPLELENIGKKIARGCRGLPSAIFMSAGLLETISKNPALWGEMMENVNAVVTTEHEQCEEVLYTHLPRHLRSSFLYLGGSLKDHETPVSKLIVIFLIDIIKDFTLLIPNQAQYCDICDLEKATEKIKSVAEQVEQMGSRTRPYAISVEVVGKRASKKAPAKAPKDLKRRFKALALSYLLGIGKLTMNSSFGINDKHQLCDSPAIGSSTTKLSPTHTDGIVSFDDNLLEIKDRLRGESSNLECISILGMGGIGKTTLARIAYDDPLIMEYFYIRAWVTISQDYNVQDILSSLVVSMEGFNADISEQSDEAKVYKSLKGRRYLIVMDDMWSTKAWDDVRNIFPNDGNGSRIVLTTRLLDVAAYPHLRSSIYEMHFMNANQSWNLLHKKVFPQQDCPPELENIGRDIARNCRGLPLAIVVVAGLLSTVSKNPASWEKIADNVNAVVAGKDGQFEEILSLSYTHLPHHLRSCFLYLSCFPEDHEIRVSKLVRLWLAEGFLKYPDGSKSFEEEAEDCLENLVKRSLVLVTKRKPNGKIKSCSLHDLMRDLCIRKASEEKFLVNIRDRNVAEGLLNQRRISITFRGPPYLLKIDGSAIHTLMWFLYTLLPSLRSFRLLRVLDAGDADVKSLPANLFDLFHLRYLAINYPKMIPGSISRLKNLQTLIIRARGQLMLEASHEDCLPDEIWSMTQLRHLFFYGTLPNPEGTTSTLVNLKTLVFSLSIHTTEEILKRIPNLRKLIIKCYDRQDRHHFSNFLNNLECLHLLETLEVRSLNCYDTWRRGDFNFPKMLKKFTLSGLRLSWNEMSAVCSLPNLQVLKLKDYNCRGETWETAEGNFPKLEYLLIEKSYLQLWITESSHFPSLRFLFIHDCWRLTDIPEGIGEINTLELIEIKGHVKRSLVESAKMIREEQQDLGNDALQVRCITH